MKTACFRNAGKDPNAVSIARLVPKQYRGKQYGPLTPASAICNINGDFSDGYRAQLAALNPKQVYADLVALAGVDALLLCNEPPGDPCHRRMAARWLGVALGIKIPESEEKRHDALVVAASPR